MSSYALVYAEFGGALEGEDLAAVLAAAAELPQIRLDDAFDVLILMARAKDRRFDGATAGWVGRLLVENSLGLRDARYARILAERRAACREALRRLTRVR